MTLLLLLELVDFSFTLILPILVAMMVPCKHLTREKVKFIPWKLSPGDFVQLVLCLFDTEQE